MAQVQLVSGYNFGQFLGAGDSAIDAGTGLDSGFIGANWAEGAPPPLTSNGADFANDVGYTNGTGTVYWDGTAGSDNNKDQYLITAIANLAPSINADTFNGTNMALIGDNTENIALNVGGAYSIGFRQNMTNYGDAGGTDLTFAAQATSSPITITWTYDGNVVATTNVGTSWAAYTVDLPSEFFGTMSDLTATFSGAGSLDNLQFNGYFGTPLPGALTFWKGGDGTWTMASTPTNWRDSVGGTDEGVWETDLATFGGTAGTVTIDNTDGDVEVTGVKFLVDGYEVTGDALTTNTAATVVQVGDESGASSSMTATISSEITGTGGINKTDAGTLILSGANTYSGTTTVTAGTLQINGVQTGSGAVAVETGATLRGTGSTAGVVTIENGGTLAGTSGSVFTMAGLTLSPTSNLNVTLGAPSTDKLFQVNGDLTLDGLLNVNTSAGFGNGTYRLIDYTGALTNNGLEIGSVVGASTDYTVMTATANQVSLLVDSTSLFRESGAGTWTTTPGSGWTNSGGGASAWTPNFAIFQGAAGEIVVDTTDGAVVFTGAQFAVDGYTVSGDTLTTNTAATNIRVGDGTSAGAAMNATISAPLTGTGGIDKRDLGTLTLTGVNTYAGGTTISEGTLKLGTGASIVDNITNNATLAFDRTDSTEFAGVISGTGSVVKQGTGTTSLTAENTYMGGTTVSAGTLSIGNGGTTGSIAGNVTNNAAVVFNRSNAATYAGNMAGTGSLTKLGAGALTLSGSNTHTGGTTVSAGSLSIGAGGTTGSLSGNITNNAAVIFNRSNEQTYAGAISGTGTVNKQGTGTTILTGDNTYTGTTTVSGGTLLINGDQEAATGDITVADGGALGGEGSTGAEVTVENGGSLVGRSESTFTMAGLTLNASSTVDITLGSADADELFAVDGDLVLDGTLNIDTDTGFGGGLYRLFTYSGTLTDNTLEIGDVASAGTFTLQTSVAEQINLLYGAASLVWNDDNTVWSAEDDSGAWDGTSGGGWQPGMAIFQGLEGGTITVDDSSGPIEVTGVQFAGHDYFIVGDAITTTTANTPFRVGDGTATGAAYVGTIDSAITGTGGINKTDLGTLVLNGTNTYTGGTRISAGALEVSSNNALGASSGTLNFNGGTLRAGAVLNIARTITVNSTGGTIDTAASAVTLSGRISGSGDLTKTGLGDLIISSTNNSHRGATTVAQGALVLNNGRVGNTSISSGARLAGIGTIQGNLTSSGIVSPGNSPGTITVVGNYTMTPTSTYAVELASATSFDKLIVGGTASLDGTLAVTGLNGYVPQSGETFKILEAAGGVSGTFATLITPFTQNSIMQRFEAAYNPFDVTLTYVQLPFAGLTGSANQQAIGAAIDAAIASNTIPNLKTALNAMTTEAAIRDAMHEISPVLYSRWYEQAVYSSESFVRQAEARLATQHPDEERGGGFWFDIVRRQTTFDATTENEEATGSANGIAVGGDVSVSDSTQVGLVFGYSDESLDLGRHHSESEIKRFSAAVYARYEAVKWFMEGVFGASYSKYSTLRHIDIPGFAGKTADGDNDGTETFASIRAGYHFSLGPTRLTPYLAAQHTGFSVDELIETGAGNANLTVHEQRAYSLATRAGVLFAFPYMSESLTLTPKVDLAWRHDFRAEAQTITAELGDSSFTVSGDEPSDSGFIAGLGLDAAFTSGITAYTRVTVESETAASKAFEARAGVDYRF